MPKPEILQLGPLPHWDQTPLEAAYTVHRLWEAEEPQALLEAVGTRVRAIVSRGSLRVQRELIDACPALEIIAVYGVGYDGVDIEACRARGICLTNTPDVLTGDVADLGVGLMLAVARAIPQADRWVRSGAWAEEGPFPLQRRVFGRRAGILGFGRIGRALARRLAGFDMTIGYCDLAPAEDAPGLTFHPDPPALAAASDVLFVTLAATPATRGIVGRAVLEALGPEGILINISRASNVDEAALIEALEAGRLAGAGLDVMAGEPRANPRLAALENVVLQPHHASGTVETRREMGELLRANLAAHFAGKPLPSPVL